MIENETYIPLKIVSGKEDGLVEYITFSKGTKSLFEVSFYRDTGQIKQVVLLLCENYKTIDDCIENPIVDSGEPSLCAGKNECAVFILCIYANGIKLVLDDVDPAKYIQVGEMYFGLNESGKIVELRITKMEDADLNHLKKELSYQ